MQCVRILTSEVTWCLRCSMRTGPKSLLYKSLSSPVNQRRLFASDSNVIPPATLVGEEKTYAPKIQRIVQDVSQLTLIEVADLVELLKKTLKIADAPMMAMGVMPSSAKAKEDEEEAQKTQAVKTSFTVKLTKFDDVKKVALIKEVKNLVPGLNLVQAKKFVESAPQPVRTDIPKEEAEQLKAALEAVGATIVIE